MTTQEIANRLVEICRTGQYETAYQELYHPDIVSIEPDGAPNPVIKGMAGIIKKGQEWAAMVEEVHSGIVSDPVVADNHFSCVMETDITFKGRGRSKLSEVCVYEVQDGKIVKEQFFYTM